MLPTSHPHLSPKESATQPPLSQKQDFILPDSQLTCLLLLISIHCNMYANCCIYCKRQKNHREYCCTLLLSGRAVSMKAGHFLSPTLPPSGKIISEKTEKDPDVLVKCSFRAATALWDLPFCKAKLYMAAEGDAAQSLGAF